jgi:hypothetical protein
VDPPPLVQGKRLSLLGRQILRGNFVYRARFDRDRNGRDRKLAVGVSRRGNRGSDRNGIRFNWSRSRLRCVQ